MAAINKLPPRVQITCTSDELRKLADKMDEVMAKCKFGESTLVQVWTSDDLEVLFHFDQERKPKTIRLKVLAQELRAGDKIIVLDVEGEKLYTFRNMHMDKLTKCWLIDVQEMSTRLQFNTLTMIPIERKI